MSAAAIWSYLGLGDTLSACEQKADEIHLVNGLQLGAPLVITAVSRSAGGINQPIAEAAGQTTLTRDP